MTEDLIRQYAELRAHKLMLNGAQRFVFQQKVIELWTAGRQAETALTEAAKEVRHG